MLDVHPPHESAHSWKDFSIHIATICVGLLIAIGLEQTVEVIHQHHERADLRKALAKEVDQIVADSLHAENAISAQIAFDTSFEKRLSESTRTHQQVGPVDFPNIDLDQPSDPIYQAAKTSNRIGLLSEDELLAFGELHEVLNNAHEMDNIRKLAGSDALELGIKTQFGKIPTTEGAKNIFDGLSDDEKRKFYNANAHIHESCEQYLIWLRQVRGAATEMKTGDRDLKKVEAAERQFDNLP